MGGNGVNVYSNYDALGKEYAVGIRWQCVELVQRLYNVRGWFKGHFGVSYAYQIYDVASRNGMMCYPDGSGYVPVPGDMIIWNPVPGQKIAAGHVAVVNRVDSDHIYICEQNFNHSGKAILNRSGTNGSRLMRVDGWGKGCIRGIVHDPDNFLSNREITNQVTRNVNKISDERILTRNLNGFIGINYGVLN
jgi:hypothetical protein